MSPLQQRSNERGKSSGSTKDHVASSAGGGQRRGRRFAGSRAGRGRAGCRSARSAADGSADIAVGNRNGSAGANRGKRDGGSARTSRPISDPDEVGAGDAGLVGVMDHDAAVAEESTDTGDKSSIVVRVGRGGARSLELAVLARVVTDLAGLGLSGITGGLFAALIRVQVSKSSSAVAALGDRLVMDVVRERALAFGETGDGDLELDAAAAADRGGDNGAANGGVLTVGQRGSVNSTGGVVGDDGSIAELASGAGVASGGDSGGGSENEGSTAHFDGVC